MDNYWYSERNYVESSINSNEAKTDYDNSPHLEFSDIKKLRIGAEL